MRLLATSACLTLMLGLAAISAANAQLPFDGRRDHRPPPRVYYHHHHHHDHRPPVLLRRDEYRR